MQTSVEPNKILVVDDDSSIGEILENMLTHENYDVDIFTRGFEAVEKVKREPARLVLLDYFLPGENTEEIISDLRSSTDSALPIVLMSASVHGEQMAKKLPVNEFISKPFQREALLAAIRRNI